MVSVLSKMGLMLIYYFFLFFTEQKKSIAHIDHTKLELLHKKHIFNMISQLYVYFQINIRKIIPFKMRLISSKF